MRHQFQCLACKGIYFDTSINGRLYSHVCGPLPATKKDPERERPNKRDENPAFSKGGRVRGIVSEGAGVKCLTASHLQEPLWISALYKRVEEEEAKLDA